MIPDTVIMLAVLSGNIGEIGYNEETQQLYVTFTSGASYVYEGVPPSVFADFRGASSKGSFFAQNIKGAYSYSKV